MHVCMHVRVCIYIYIYIYTYMYVCVHVYIARNRRALLWTDRERDACMYVCMHVCMYVCIYIYIYIYMYMHLTGSRDIEPQHWLGVERRICGRQAHGKRNTHGANRRKICWGMVAACGTYVCMYACVCVQ